MAAAALVEVEVALRALPEYELRVAGVVHLAAERRAKADREELHPRRSGSGDRSSFAFWGDAPREIFLGLTHESPLH